MGHELKPCPFCGGKARFSHFDVMCIDCGVTAYGNECTAETAKAWNARAPDAAEISRLTEEVERLRGEVVEQAPIGFRYRLPGRLWDFADGDSSIARGHYQNLEVEAVYSVDTVGALTSEVARLSDLADKYKWQVRDTCTRAEAAEARIKELEAERATMSKALERANDRLGSIEVPAMRGDNLAVTLCTHFDDGGDDEDDDCGWGPAALNGYEQTIKAIRDHYNAAFPTLSHKEG